MRSIRQTAITLSLLATFLSATPAFAATTLVAGKVTQNNSPVSGASVHVVCNSNGKDTTTNGSGDYGVEYTTAECPNASTAFVTASKNGNTGSDSGTVNHLTANIDLAIVNVPLAVPEYGLITGIIAVTGAVAYFFLQRKKAYLKA